MLVVLVTRLKHKILKGLRLMLVLLILSVLICQLAGLLRSSGFPLEEKIPSGNPMKVLAPISQVLCCKN
ncbi:hypothetical protein [Desulforamulus hydrothermalis]|uniref:Uncharacterized protein n=1 Tax=Desulforamulus hydrothermalis Lam5 = DSM 18033 TaxID=1121428 RepID=K8E0H5_9FIRM|nr:hypothetical protein [Desulforamulus hydrothermalis]CCO08955.1 conserved exported hypothetical protein [Desulforamulus hydrothermalis Lam5 = DSM 18033]SHG75614.1 hypothetical protein SAMN02745177_00272 [Desulforamulus hydrothermalis Lam5 = DSM 18033]